MPSWAVHEKWAAKLGLPDEITRFANHLSDFPDQCEEFREFCEREGEAIVTLLLKSHEFETIMKIPKYLQLQFMQRKGCEYSTAWYLHYVLDYIRMAPSLSAEEVLQRTEERFESCEELETVQHFIRANEAELVHDCRV
jgi:hypothetical protein